MKAKHAPGPWRIVRSADYTDDPGDTQIMSVEAADGVTILFTDSGYFKPREADARLIAAAPDLLAALEGLMNYVGGWDEAATHPCGIARDAIAKAIQEG